MQTLKQMRETGELGGASPPAQATLMVPGCYGRADACGWDEFQKAVERSIDRSAVVTADRN
jgi:hypothetical protein